MITDEDRELASNFVLALSDLDDIEVVVDAVSAAREQAEGRRGRPALPQDEQKAHINITIDRDLLDLIDHHSTNRSRFINKILRKEFSPMKTFRYELVNTLSATDLCAEAEANPAAVAYRITIYDATGTRAAPETAQALYIDGRLGIAWGADATWADVDDVESGIEMWLNDGEAWEARN